MKTLLTLVAALAAVGLTPGPAAAQTDFDLAAVRDLVSAHLGPTGLPGVAVAVTRGDEIVHVGGYGHTSEGEPVTAETLMPIGSVSKGFTALAVMQLVEAGEVALDEPVVSYLPEFATADGRGADITVRQLLNHTSGLSDAVHHESAIAQPDSLAEAVKAVSTVDLAADPGAEHHYHNPNYQIAARIVEVASGQSFEDYLRERVFAPAGMDATLALVNETDPVEGLAEGHNRWFGLNLVREASDRFVSGSAGIVSTADDLAAWLLVNAGTGEPLVSPATLEAMHAPSSPEVAYGLGWDTYEVDGTPQTVHTGSTFTYTAEIRLLPESGYGFAVMSNSRQPLEAETEAIMEGLIALSQGDSYETALPLAFILDMVLTATALLGIGLLIRRVFKAGSWAERRARAPRWRIGLTALPTFALAALLLLLPFLLSALSARDVTWTLVWHLIPTLPASLAILVACGIAGSVIRLRALRVRALAGRGEA
ncbi:serine hydrolase domain-containing protein [Glycomyces sp. NPDC046736]|uniref:serine hydrolase domain-containing protein n=1 Tax=Glycomyces sp. NPDC046736 TaxID=3155615 RepID=UPI0033D1C7BB